MSTTRRYCEPTSLFVGVDEPVLVAAEAWQMRPYEVPWLAEIDPRPVPRLFTAEYASLRAPVLGRRPSPLSFSASVMPCRGRQWSVRQAGAGTTANILRARRRSSFRTHAVRVAIDVVSSRTRR